MKQALVLKTHGWWEDGDFAVLLVVREKYTERFRDGNGDQRILTLQILLTKMVATNCYLDLFTYNFGVKKTIIP